jgi:DNA-binding protein
MQVQLGNQGIEMDQQMDQGNMVRIGKKPVMNYVVACVTLLNHGVRQVMIRARGQTISKAVDVVEMLRRSFMKNLEIGAITIGSEEIRRFDGRPASISTIEILLNKKE